MLKHSRHILALPSFQNACRMQIRYKRTTDPRKIILNRVENKLVYGELIETNAERRRKLQLQKEARVRYVSKTNNNTELFWTLNHSNVPLAEAKVHLNNQEFDVSDQPYTHQNLSKNVTQSYRNRCIKIISPDFVTGKVRETNCENDNLKRHEPKSTYSDYPSDYVLKHMQSFMIPQRKVINPSDVNTSKILTIAPEDEGRPLSHIPSVTKVLRDTMAEESKLALEKWQQKMIDELGEEGFKEYSKELLSNAKALHICIENTLTDVTVTVPEKIMPAYESIQRVLEEISEVKATESHVIHPTLCYRGIIDCIAVYRNKLCVIDWKNSSKKRKSISETYDAPVQIASYIGAINSSERYPFLVNTGLVVVGYMSGESADVFEINSRDVNRYWKQWLKRLQQYYVAKGNEKVEK